MRSMRAGKRMKSKQLERYPCFACGMWYIPYVTEIVPADKKTGEPRKVRMFCSKECYDRTWKKENKSR